MQRTETVMSAALSRAGLNTAERRLRMLATDALKKHHGNVERAVKTFERDVDGDVSLVREALLHYLKTFGGHSPSVNLLETAAEPRNGAGHVNIANLAKDVRPVREPSALDRAAAARVATQVAVTILDTYKIRDGRAIGDVRYGELERLRGLNHMEAAIIRQIQKHAQAPHDARVRDVVKAVDLNRMIQKAAEIADAS